MEVLLLLWDEVDDLLGAARALLPLPVKAPALATPAADPLPLDAQPSATRP